MKAEQILEAQMDLLERARDNALFRRQQATGVVTEAEWNTYADVMANAVRRAYAYRVSADMSQLLAFAASQLDESDEWDHTLAPTEAGLVRLDAPLTLVDPYGNKGLAHWMLWGPSLQGGTFVYFWNDMREPDETSKRVLRDFHPETLRAIGYWGSIGGTAGVPDGSSLGPVEVSPFTWDVDLRDRRIDGVKQATAFGDVPVPLRPVSNMARFVHAFWLLLNQPVVETEQPHVKARTQRSADRAGITSNITVVQLRRTSGSRGAGESTVEWSRRWVVRGHWRWQAYGVGRSERRRIWIDPFTKGPEDKPLVITSKVYDVG